MKIENQPGRKPVPEEGVCGVAIDEWKLKIFTKILTKGGYKFEKKTSKEKILILQVAYTSKSHLEALGDLVQKAQRECSIVGQGGLN